MQMQNIAKEATRDIDANTSPEIRTPNKCFVAFSSSSLNSKY